MTEKEIAQKNSLRRKFRLSEFFAEYVIKSVAFLSFAMIILIFVFVFKETLPIFSPQQETKSNQEFLQSETYGEEPGSTSPEQQISEYSSLLSVKRDIADLDNLTGKEWQPVGEVPKYGLLPIIMGSLKVTLIAVFIGAPLAILAAIFSALFAPKKIKELIKPAVELLASFPSVVVGFFALVTLATFLQDMFGWTFRLNSFVGGLAMALAVIPIIYTVTEDAITAVPKYMKEASFALGANKWQTALFVILPAATPGVFAALLLGFGRAFGETMIVLMATGNAPLSSLNPFEPVRTLSATIGAEMAEVVFGDTHYTVLFLIGSLLFIVTFLINAIAEFYVRAKLMKRFRGE
ncbi:MAG: phosphate transport system permease protein [Ignavibacteria bacterium]|nr:MAG: phosphate transport system permease protein [Ignavibacteria bacterium]KAF0161129.1 MAG: phosphate transport system permease protein [Ignavibacteria bacterium]